MTTGGAGRPPPRLAVRCRLDGTVVEVAVDTVGTGVAVAQLVTEILVDGSVEDGLWLLTEAADPPETTGLWELAVRATDGTAHELRFLGCPGSGEGLDREVWLLAAGDQAELVVLLQDLAAVAPTLAACAARLTPDPGDPAVDPDRATLLAFSAANNELMAMHREVARQSAELAALNRRKDDILAMVAHDLRSPLGSITGFAEVLLRELDGVLDDRSRLMLDRIGQLSEHLLVLVDDLLDAAAISQGSLQLDRRATDIAGLVRDAVDSHRHAAERKGIHLAVDLPDTPLVAEVDPHRLMQVLDNLVSNAVKFSPVAAGARILVRCAPADTDTLRLEVEDEGVGICEEDLARLFEPYVRGASRATAAERSTGLGLAITRSIVTAHGGTIQATSRVGHGSVFTVTVPRQAGAG